MVLRQRLLGIGVPKSRLIFTILEKCLEICQVESTSFYFCLKISYDYTGRFGWFKGMAP